MIKLLLAAVLSLAIARCSLPEQDGPPALVYPPWPATVLSTGTPATTYETANTFPITVTNGIAGGIPNTPMVSVTICIPGTTTCQTVNNILLDTGSSGLRIFKSLVTVALPYSLVGPNPYQECVSYADGSSTYGTVYLADVNLGTATAAGQTVAGETASSVPMQLIDNVDCSGASNTPTSFGSNGILGVRMMPLDCGLTECDSPAYYVGQYQLQPVPTANQLANPIAMMPQDNNGFLISIPTVAAGGAANVSGTLTMGLDTQANNATTLLSPAPVIYPADGNGFIVGSINGTASPSTIIDSGSSVLFLPQANFAAGATYPTSCGGAQAGLFCPATSPQSYSIGITGAAGQNPTTVTVSIENASTIHYGTTNTNTAFSTVGGDSGDPTFLSLGLPFFFGRPIQFAIDQRPTAESTGPYNAF